jgi:hypothetical protein
MMIYRGVCRDGVVVLDDEVELREGTRVRVTPARSGKVGAEGAARPGPQPKPHTEVPEASTEDTEDGARHFKLEI